MADNLDKKVADCINRLKEMDSEESKKENSLNCQEDDDVVTPWSVESQNAAGVDYDKLISKYCVRPCLHRKFRLCYLCYV